MSGTETKIRTRSKRPGELSCLGRGREDSTISAPLLHAPVGSYDIGIVVICDDTATPTPDRNGRFETSDRQYNTDDNFSRARMYKKILTLLHHNHHSHRYHRHGCFINKDTRTAIIILSIVYAPNKSILW